MRSKLTTLLRNPQKPQQSIRPIPEDSVRRVIRTAIDLGITSLSDTRTPKRALSKAAIIKRALRKLLTILVPSAIDAAGADVVAVKNVEMMISR
jgi:hypothetical protein